MSSQVNPSTIDPTFPVPGINNSTQGFRNNFSAIQSAFAQYVAEMNDLINKAVVSAPLKYGASNVAINNFGGTQNANLSLYDFGYVSYNLGNVSASGTANVNFQNGYVQKLTLTAASTVQTIAIQSFPAMGYSEILLDVTATAVPQYLNFANLVSGATAGNVSTSGNTPISGYTGSTANYVITKSNVPYYIKLGSLDGNNWVISTTTSAVSRTGAPSAGGIGAPGDTAGMMSYDTGGNAYVCTGSFNGSTRIWYKLAGITF